MLDRRFPAAGMGPASQSHLVCPLHEGETVKSVEKELILIGEDPAVFDGVLDAERRTECLQLW